MKAFFKNIDKRVVMLSGFSVTAALVFWGFTAVLRKMREKKALELLRENEKKEGAVENSEAEAMIKELSSEELRDLIAAAEKGKGVLDFKNEILEMKKRKENKNKKQK